MDAIVAYLLTGLSVGSVYAMVGLGFYVMWSAAKAVNFNYGDLFMLGAVLTVVLRDFGVPLLAAAAVSITTVAVIAAAIERGFVRPFNREANAVGWMLTTIAVGTMLEASTTVLFGSNPRGLPTPLMERPLRLGGAGIYPQELLLPVALVVVTAGQSSVKLPGHVMTGAVVSTTVTVWLHVFELPQQSVATQTRV